MRENPKDTFHTYKPLKKKAVCLPPSPVSYYFSKEDKQRMDALTWSNKKLNIVEYQEHVTE